MKNKIVLFLAVALTGPLLSQPMFADITYTYTGNPFHVVNTPYTTSDFVTGMLTLAAPLAANLPLSSVTPISFTFSDGVQTIAELTVGDFSNFQFATGPSGEITMWDITINHNGGKIGTDSDDLPGPDEDFGFSGPAGFGSIEFNPGLWRATGSVSDTGSTLSLMTLTLMALGVAARQFKRAAA
jgi:hypothetical protein